MVGKSSKNSDVVMMLDSGASPNLIKNKYLRENTKINKFDLVELHGITNIPISTLGSVTLRRFGKNAVCHVVPNNMAIPYAGLVGSEFFVTNGAKIDYINRVLEIDDMKFPFKKPNRIKEGFMYVPRRSESTFFVKVKNPEIKDGYIPKLSICPGVYAGKCLVRVNNDRAYLQIYNTTDNEVGIRIPTITIREVEESHDPTPVYQDDHQKDIHGDFGINKYTFTTVRDFQNTNKYEQIKSLLRLDHSDHKEKTYIERIVKRYADRFYIPGEPLGSSSKYQHRIPTHTDRPITTKQYRIPQALKPELERQVREGLETGISPNNSPVCIVPKNADPKGNKRWRIVIDFRLLNKETITDAYPLPNITDILDQLGGSVYFSVFDLASGYHQIEMDPKGHHKTAFSTPQGH